VLATMGSTILVGCANQQVTRTGFIQDYNSLSPVEGSKKIFVRRPSQELLSRYNSVWVQPVEIKIPGPEDQKALLEIAALAEKELKNTLGKNWRLANAPGLKTLRGSTALTAVHKSQPAANIVLTIVAVPMFNGGLSAEVKILDASGQEIGAVIWADEGVWNPVGYYSEYGHPRALTEELAKSVASTLKLDKEESSQPQNPSQ
jgi:hypothetical protein